MMFSEMLIMILDGGLLCSIVLSSAINFHAVHYPQLCSDEMGFCHAPYNPTHPYVIPVSPLFSVFLFYLRLHFLGYPIRGKHRYSLLNLCMSLLGQKADVL